MPHFDTTFRINDVLVICGAIYVVGRLVIGKLSKIFREIDRRLELHEQALVHGGFLKRDRRGQLEIPMHAGRRSFEREA